ACPRIADSDFTFRRAEQVTGDVCVAAEHDNRARSHVFLFADDAVDALAVVVIERFVWVLEQAWPPRRLWRRHRRREVYDPSRVRGKAAHHLECGDRVLLADRDIPVKPSRYVSFSEDVFDIK